MPIQLPDLAGKTYKDIVDEMIVSIPKYSDKWTNFNPADPGITIIELLSWISDMTLYRINRIPDESYVNFLRMVAGASGAEYIEKVLDELTSDDNKKAVADRAQIKLLEFLKEIENGNKKSVSDIKSKALEFLDSHYRAVTETDFQQLSKEATENNDVKVKRAIVRVSKDTGRIEIIIVSDMYLFGWDEIPGNDSLMLIFFLRQNFGIDWGQTAKIEKIDNGKTIKVSAGSKYLSLKLNDEKTSVKIEIYDGRTDNLVAKIEDSKPNIYSDINDEAEMEKKYNEMTSIVKNYLHPRRLIGTRIDVKKPEYTPLAIDIVIFCRPYAREGTVKNKIKEAILKYLDPFEGGPNEDGWPYGWPDKLRPLTVFEIDRIIEETDGVDRTKSVKIFKRIPGVPIAIPPSTRIEIEGLIKISNEDITIKVEEAV